MKTSEVTTLSREARRFLEAECPMSIVRGADPSTLWKQMAELGWIGVAVDEEQGGLGLGTTGLSVLAREAGRAVAPTPFLFAAALAAPILAAAKDNVLAHVLSGQTILAVASDGYVVDADNAERIVVVDEASATIVGAHDAGVEIAPTKWIDLARHVALFRMTAQCTGVRLAVPDLSRIIASARVAVAAESLGAAERSLEIATGYAKQRVQFGKPIGSFQAVQHLLARMLERVELVRSAVDGAARALDSNDPHMREKSLIAKAIASEHCVGIAADCIQVHGGIGFTWEHDAHLYYRRAVGNAALLGSAAWCRTQLGTCVLGP